MAEMWCFCIPASQVCFSLLIFLSTNTQIIGSPRCFGYRDNNRDVFTMTLPCLPQRPQLTKITSIPCLGHGSVVSRPLDASRDTLSHQLMSAPLT
jgi:hypothetical protein